MAVAKPSAGSTEARLLNATLKCLKGGDLEQAIVLLGELRRLAPEDERYALLQASAQALLDSQRWYRFQRRFEPAWVAPQ